MATHSRLNLVRGSLRWLWASKTFGISFPNAHAERLKWADLDPNGEETFELSRRVVWEEGLQFLQFDAHPVDEYAQIRRDFLAWDILASQRPDRFRLADKGQAGKAPEGFEEWRDRFISSFR